MQLLTGRGDGHGHVHHRPQRRDEDAADQQTADGEGTVVGAEHQIFRLAHIEAADGGDLAYHPGEKRRRRHTAHTAQARAQGFAGKAGEHQQGSRRRQRRDEHCRPDGVRPFEHHGDEEEPDTRQGIGQTQQGHDALFAADDHQQKSKDRHHARQHDPSIVVGNGDYIGLPVVIQIEAHDDPGAQRTVHVGIGAEIIGGFQNGPLIGPTANFQLHSLSAQTKTFAPRLRLGVVRQYVGHLSHSERPLLGRRQLGVFAPQRNTARHQNEKKEKPGGNGCRTTPGQRLPWLHTCPPV